jgi:TonB family protein
MHPRFTNAAVCSVLLHSGIFAVLLVVSLQVRTSQNVTPVVMELVTLGAQWATETRASAMTVTIPQSPLRSAVESRAQVASQATPNKPTPAVTPAVAPSRTTVPNRARAPIPTAARPPANNPGRSSAPAPSARPVPPVPRVDTAWNFPAESTTGSSGARSDMSAAPSGSELDLYFAGLIRKLRAALEIPEGVGDQLSAVADVLVSADGRLSDARLVRSSGNAMFDQAVLNAIRQTRMSARPDGKSDVVTIPFTTRRTSAFPNH